MHLLQETSETDVTYFLMNENLYFNVFLTVKKENSISLVTPELKFLA